MQSVGIKENEMVNLMINLTYPVTTDVKISHSPTGMYTYVMYIPFGLFNFCSNF